jgi:hypothetical protein
MLVDPESAKNTVKSSVFFVLSGSAHTKAARHQPQVDYAELDWHCHFPGVNPTVDIRDLYKLNLNNSLIHGLSIFNYCANNY